MRRQRKNGLKWRLDKTRPDCESNDRQASGRSYQGARNVGTLSQCDVGTVREHSLRSCRVGNGPVSAGSQLKDFAWFNDNAARTTHSVATLKPNPWGLYDMLGNVAEWCNDRYDENYYRASPDRNPRGPAEGKLYVLRGGAWGSKAEGCRPTYRIGENPGFQDACFARDAIGLRCVRRPSAEEAGDAAEGPAKAGAEGPRAE